MGVRVLIVDDDSSVTISLSLLLKQAGYVSLVADSPNTALDVLAKEKVELVIQDMNFSRQTSGQEGLQLLQQIKLQYPDLPIILITAWGSISLAVKGIQLGASDFITKPWTNQQILQSVATVLGLVDASTKKQEQALTREQLEKIYNLRDIVGTDPKFLKILELACRVSSTDASVLITGESGTGKEVLASVIHHNSKRRDGAFIKVNLGGIPVSLFESEMFGHIKGAFTDAHQNRKGRFELAAGGSIFLDEIGDLDPSSQVKMLRVLQDRTYEVLGSSVTKTVDVRVISATNRNLNEMVSKGTFREDLLYRLNLIALHIPPLRERPDDIPIIARHFLTKLANTYSRESLKITDRAMQWLQGLDWSGNIRQLKHLLERVVLVCSSDQLDRDDFAICLQMESPETKKEVFDSLPEVGSMTIDELEKAMILKSLKFHAGNISKVAESLGLSRTSLYRRLEKYGIKI